MCDGHTCGNSAGLYGWATVYVVIDVGTRANHRYVPRHLCVYKWRENPIYIAVRRTRMVSFIVSVPREVIFMYEGAG